MTMKITTPVFIWYGEKYLQFILLSFFFFLTELNTGVVGESIVLNDNNFPDIKRYN